jgi:hypothetical protein
MSFQNFANKFYPKLYSIDLDIYNADLLPGDYLENSDIAILPPSLPLCKTTLNI